MNAGAIIVAQQRQAVAAFREKGCTRPEAARPLEELAVRRGFAVGSLIRRGVLREVESGRFWLDEEAWERLSTWRRRVVTVVLLVAAIVVAVALVLD